MKREVSAAVLSDIALTDAGFILSALAEPAIISIPVLAGTIVLTGDHAGPGTLGLDTDIDARQPNGVGNQNIFSDDLRDLRGNIADHTSSVCIATSPFTGDRIAPFPCMEGASAGSGMPSTTARSPCGSSSLTITSSRRF